MMTISADGYSLPPLIILQKLKKLPPELGDLVGRAHFSTSKNGWITKKLFYVWCVYFVNIVSKYRAEVLPLHLRNMEMVLFVDSHNSRLFSEALTFLKIKKIRLITLLAHSSHLTQPFASPFKNALAQFFSLRDTKYPELVNYNGVSYMRRLLILSVIDAWQVATCRSSVMKAFRDTGIFPFTSEPVLNCPMVRETSTNDLLFIPRNQRFSISGKELTSDHERLTIHNHLFGTNFENVDEIPLLDLTKMSNVLYFGPDNCMMLHLLPPYYHQVAAGIMFLHY